MAVSADRPGFTAAPCQLAPSGTGTQNRACEEKVQDISSLARNSLSVKSHVPFLLSQGGGITAACTSYPDSQRWAHPMTAALQRR